MTIPAFTTLTTNVSSVFPSSPVDTASVSVTAGDWVEIEVMTFTAAGAATAVSGLGITWTSIRERQNPGRQYIRAWGGFAPSTTSGVISVTCSGVAEIAWTVGYTTGVDVTTPIVTANTVDNAGTGTGPSVGMTDRTGTGNVRRCAVGSGQNTGTTGTQGTDFTERVDFSTATLNNFLFVQEGATNTDPAMTLSNSPSEGWAIIAWELKEATAGGIATLTETELPPRQAKYPRAPQQTEPLTALAPTGGPALVLPQLARARRMLARLMDTESVLPALAPTLPLALQPPELPQRRQRRTTALSGDAPHRVPVPVLEALEPPAQRAQRKSVTQAIDTPVAMVVAATSTLPLWEMPSKRRIRRTAAEQQEVVLHYPGIIEQSTFEASSDTGPYSVPYPSVSRGDLLVMFLVVDGASNIDRVPLGWTLALQDSSPSSMCDATLYRVADGSETGTADSTGGASEQWVGRILRIVNFDSNTPLLDGARATGTSTSPNPPNNTPTWGFDDQLWLAHSAANGNVLHDAGPSNCVGFAALRSSGTALGRVSSGFAYLQRPTTAFNPTAFSLDTSADWAANTYSVRPYRPLVQPILRSTSFAPAASGSHSMSFTLDAGSNRRLLVWLSISDSGGTPPDWTSVTYGGVTMALATDGTTTATVTFSTSKIRCYTLRESQLPSNGANNIVATLASGSHSITCTAMVVSGTAQDVNLSSVDTGTAAGSTTVTASPVVTEDYTLLVAGQTTDDITQPDALVDTTGTPMFGRGAASTDGVNSGTLDVRAKELTTESGAQATTFTGASFRRLLISIALAPAGAESPLATYLQSPIGQEVRRKIRRVILEQPATLGATQRSSAPLAQDLPARPSRRRAPAHQPGPQLTPITVALRQQVEPQAEEKPVRKRSRLPDHTDKFAAIVPPALLPYVETQHEPQRQRRRVVFAIDSEALEALEAPDAPVLPGKPVEFRLTVSEPQEFRLQANAPVEFKLLAPITSFRRPWQ